MKHQEAFYGQNVMKGINPKLPTCKKQKIEKTHVKEKKQSHAQDSIYVI